MIPSKKDSPVFALIDCNNFFVSCERLFQPRLNRVPVAVLSNNDACLIARSNEVKALGIKMGDPYFKHKALLRAHKAEVFSANFGLYGDIAERVSAVLATYAPNIEIYSIDEAFLQINNLSITDYNRWAKMVSSEVGRLVGIPVSVGVGPTKTLAKVAVEKVKKTPDLCGGFSLAEDERLNGYDRDLLMEETLRWLPLEDVWGIGRRYARRLHQLGLRTAFDFTQLTDEWVLNNMTIRGLRTLRELQGESTIPLDLFENDNQQKTLSVTRMFGERVRSLAELEAAVATFAARAATRLRRKEQLAWEGSVFIRAHFPNNTSRFFSADFRLDVPTSYTSDVIKGAHQALQTIYDPSFGYRKAGIVLRSLVDESDQQMSLFGTTDQAERMSSQISLMKAMDDISLRYGKNAVTYVAELHNADKWKSNRKQITPAYTTKWSDLPVISVFQKTI